MYTVIGFPRTRAMRVIWMLEEIGEPYEISPAQPRSPEALAVNPSGKVPALRDGKHTITDSIAIITYLADKHGKLTFPAGTYERALQDSFTQFCVDEIEGALWTAAKNSFVHPEDHRTPGVKATCQYEFDNAMKTLETRLGSRTFVMGDTFTLPDILFGHCANWAENGAKWKLPGGAVGDYLDRVRARPALARAMERSKEVMTA